MKEFIDEFKHLEKLCNEIYAEKHGVTQYINEMKQKSGFAYLVTETDRTGCKNKATSARDRSVISAV